MVLEVVQGEMSVLLRGQSLSTRMGIPQIVGQSGFSSSQREVKQEGVYPDWRCDGLNRNGPCTLVYLNA